MQNAPQKVDILSLTADGLSAFFKEMNQPKFRAGQVFDWLHNKRVSSFAQMTNLPAPLREQLEASCGITAVAIEEKQTSKVDGTVKYLYRLPDGNCIETVLMKYKHGNSLCISTQVGCRMGCKFCASTLGGLTRSLTPAEMLCQVYATVSDSGQRVDSLVLMGIGEPLDNFDNVMDFLAILTDSGGYNLGQRHISISTCGLVDGIERLMKENLQITLSVSLHATNNQARSATMPVNNRWPIEELTAVCRRYVKHTGRRISFEYALIAGVNDSSENARELAKLLGGMLCHVNLIPINPVVERGYQKSSRTAVLRFQKELAQLGINATVRRELGTDIDAACGQLRHKARKGSSNEDNG